MMSSDIRFSSISKCCDNKIIIRILEREIFESESEVLFLSQLHFRYSNLAAQLIWVTIFSRKTKIKYDFISFLFLIVIGVFFIFMREGGSICHFSIHKDQLSSWRQIVITVKTINTKFSGNEMHNQYVYVYESKFPIGRTNSRNHTYHTISP